MIDEDLFWYSCWERWVPCPGFPNYLISDRARVRSVSTGRMKCQYLVEGSRRDNGRDRTRYWKVDLYLDGKQYKRRVHRLVCEAFHGPPPSPRHIVLHGGAGSLCGWAMNLRWGTHLENNLDIVAAGNHRGFLPRVAA